MLPSTDRVKANKEQKITIWVYGPPMSGKTTLADTFPTPLILNTDGNTKFVTAPRLTIRDQVKVTGRLTDRKLAWVYFKEIIDELEKEKNEFETIVLDLFEDLYEYCRLYIYDRENIEHESDNSFKAWDMVTNEFLNTIKRLLTLNYNFVLLSHEDLTRDITNVKGDNITQIKPNLRDKVAVKVSGMVDAVGRLEVKTDGTRVLNFKQDAVTFGGYRIQPHVYNSVESSYDNIKGLYDGTAVEYEAKDRRSR